jgi:hypothetical protein
MDQIIATWALWLEMDLTRLIGKSWELNTARSLHQKSSLLLPLSMPQVSLHATNAMSRTFAMKSATAELPTRILILPLIRLPLISG